LTVPLYGQQNNIYAGPASAQMVMNSYPPPGTPMYFAQSVIWTSIQSHNSGEPGWATDPQGMQGALLELNPPPVGTWSIKSYDVKEDLMFQVLFWMNYNNYAVPTLVNSGYHWVVVVGYETDIEPIYGSDPELIEITINNPWPIGSGQTETMEDDIWYTTYWANPVENPGTWYNKYVAVIEPPEAEGVVRFTPVDRRGTDEISCEAALQYAETWINQLNLAAKDPSYVALNDPDKENYGPLLVREGLSFGKTVKDVPYYYIIPYYVKTNAEVISAFDNEVNDGVKVCVIVNAFTGRYEEVASFNSPINYIYKAEALQIAAEALGVETRALNGTLVYEACALCQSRVTPFWEVFCKEKEIFLYVDQERKVYKNPQSVLYGR
ncbi:hypothetical protein ACFLQP_02975, partial [Acidobacteriota bacterium]